MKKSNKLLLGGFLTILLFITAIHVTWSVKYNRGNYTVYNAEQDPELMESFPGVSFVSLLNIQDASVTFSDGAQVMKDVDKDIIYVRDGDTLKITGNYNPNHPRYSRQVAINIPSNAVLSLNNCFSVSFRVSKKNNSNSHVVYLNKTRAVFSGIEKPFQLGDLRIVAADSSTAAFLGNASVSKLDVQLSNSSLEYNEGKLGQLSIVTDSASRISLPYKHLSAAKITTVADE